MLNKLGIAVGRSISFLYTSLITMYQIVYLYTKSVLMLPLNIARLLLLQRELFYFAEMHASATESFKDGIKIASGHVTML